VLVAGLDIGGSSVKAWVHQIGGELVSSVTIPTTALRDGFRVEFEPMAWLAACREALAAAVRGVAGEWAGLTVSSLRQGFLLLDAAGAPLGNGVLNSDRRGAPFVSVLEGKYDLTGHWPAPELTLPKLLAVQAQEPDRWSAARRMLFVHDWVIACLTGIHLTEVSYACSGGMADVAARGWAGDLLRSAGVGPDLLAPIVEAGTVVGPLLAGWALPKGTPVVAGCGDTQLAAMGAGGLAPGVVTVVAGSSTPVAAAVDAVSPDPLGCPWVSTHARDDLWVLEGNAGYPGSFSRTLAACWPSPPWNAGRRQRGSESLPGPCWDFSPTQHQRRSTAPFWRHTLSPSRARSRTSAGSLTSMRSWSPVARLVMAPCPHCSPTS
jgi:sugar (pentulose or hexulose) kinase